MQRHVTRVPGYLQQLAFEAQETSRESAIVSSLPLAFLKLVPETVSELERVELLGDVS
jgi:hypothetical protein